MSVPHDSALGHVTGGARYLDDLPHLPGELTVDFVGAPCAAGRLLLCDLSAAAALPGVVALLTHRDVPGHNRFGPIVADEPFLVEERIDYLGQPIVVIAATDRRSAAAARRAVRLEVVAEEPVLDIETAAARALFLCPERRIARGDLEGGWSAARHHLTGVFRSKGQEQFYFESQATLAIPGEGAELLIESSTQNPTETQKVVAEVLGLGQHQVVCSVRRMGGGFGGKETQGALPALMAALVARRTRRPARVVYGKDLDMRVTGKRHAYRTDYRIGFDDTGRILVAELDLLSDGGAFTDLSPAVLERSMLHVDNAYFLPNVCIRGRVCRTNTPPNTAFRGFGGPQAVAVIENVMEEIALRLGCDALVVRRRNLYDATEDAGPSSRSTTPYGQVVRGNVLPELFDQLEASSDYQRRARAVATWNSQHRETLRGLSLVPVKFGISFTNKTLNQANALVNVYTDGTVQVSTGATEMGQGVNTKIAQIVAAELGVPLSQVVVMPTSTEKNNNTSPTAASASTDLNGMAAVRACGAIRERLRDVARAHLATTFGVAPGEEDVVFAEGRVRDRARPEHSVGFADLTALAHRERVDLGARGFYATPDIDFDRETGRGNPFYYFTTGCAVAEVLIDRLTGELAVERLDVLMDLGRLINEGIERGQVIGGLMQGVGWVTTEELVYASNGALLSTSPTTYKIPNMTDLPRVVRVELFEHDRNAHNLRSTKAVGEPPLMLGIAVWTAIKHALSFTLGTTRVIPELALPATHEAILLCAERLAAAGPRPAGVTEEQAPEAAVDRTTAVIAEN